MNIMFTCGGTGGHINPAIAVANEMRERHPDCHILFVGDFFCEVNGEAVGILKLECILARKNTVFGFFHHLVKQTEA